MSIVNVCLLKEKLNILTEKENMAVFNICLEPSFNKRLVKDIVFPHHVLPCSLITGISIRV